MQNSSLSVLMSKLINTLIHRPIFTSLYRIARIKREKKEKERQQRDMDLANRRHLANMRVVQKNLVYIIGLHPKLATEETIRSADYFGHFGKIAKIVINKRQVAPTSHANGATSMQPSAAVYVTYVRKEDAAKAIHAVDGSVMAGRILRASYGTTKYCTYYLRNMTCPNPNCLYLHEPGEDADTISKEELATGKHRMRDQMANDDSDDEHDQEDMEDDFRSASTKDERSALPATASWGKTSTPGTPIAKSSQLPERALTPDAFGPPLAVAVAQQQQQQQQQKQQLSPSVLKRKLEKKKRKELLRQKKEEEGGLQQLAKEKSVVEQPSTSTPTAAAAPQKEALEFDHLVHFVLGDAFNQVCLPDVDSSSADEEDKPVGVSGLYSSDEDGNAVQTPSSSSSNHAVETHLTEELNKLNFDTISPLEFLTQAVPTPAYTGTFNPFAHQLLRTSPPIENTSLFDSPVRKTSRFGFAQF